MIHIKLYSSSPIYWVPLFFYFCVEARRMYCVPIKTGIKTNNPHIFPVHQKAKKGRGKKKKKKRRERTNSKAFMHAILSPHHFISSTTGGERVCDQRNPDPDCIFQVTWDSARSNLRDADAPPKQMQIPSRSFAFARKDVEQPC